MMEVLEAIRTKRAVRQYTDQPVPEAVIRTIVNAGRLSQSSRNSQPWHFVVVRDRDRLQELADCGNYAGHVANSAFTVVLVSAVEWTFDIGQAAAYLQLAGWSQGVSSCIATLHDEACAKELLGVPDEQHIEIALAFGYAAKSPGPASPSGRRSFEDVVRWEHW